MKELLRFLWDCVFLIVLFVITVLPASLRAEEPKHINPSVTITGDVVNMKLEFWKHVVDTLDWQGKKIDAQQIELINLREANKAKKDCT